MGIFGGSGMAYSLVKPSFSIFLSSSMLVIFLSSLVFLVQVHADPMSLTLKRAFPNHEMNLNQLRVMDMQRHGRMLQSTVVNFPLNGTSNPFLTGFYYTAVYLGSPPTEFHVQIDTGSDVPWVNCVPCNGCPRTSHLPIKLNYFDPRNSSTSSVFPCSHDCDICSTNNHCSYDFQYEDGGRTSGYAVLDLMHISYISDGHLTLNYSVPLVFGCSNMRSGRLAMNENVIDGIFGFGKDNTSLISQLYSQRKVPKVFSHCLKGDSRGGGVLVLGGVVEQNMHYTPLIPKQPHYNINLESISINGHTLDIDPAVFLTSSNKGAIVDSGTTFAYFIEGAYNPIIDRINHIIPSTIGTTISYGFPCYFVNTSVLNVNHIFPLISLNFANNASLILKPQDYLIQLSPIDEGISCLGFYKSQDVTILGDIILKDKVIVYDLESQRIGWTNYNCSLPLNVSTPSNGKGKSKWGGTSFRPKKLTIVLNFITYMILILI